MFKIYNFHFKGKINEQAMSSNLITKLQGCWWGGPAPLLEETLQKPSEPSPHPTPRRLPSHTACAEAGGGRLASQAGGVRGWGPQASFAERRCCCRGMWFFLTCPTLLPKDQGVGGHAASPPRSHSGCCQKGITASGARRAMHSDYKET